MNKERSFSYKDLAVAIIDDHEVVLQGIYSFLSKQGFSRVDVFGNRESLEASLVHRNYDIYIVDMEVGNDTGLDIIDGIRSRYAAARVIVYTMHEEIWMVRNIQSKDVNGVLYKSHQMEQVLEAIDAVMAGKKFYSDKYQRSLRRCSDKMQELSKREKEILNMIAQGLSSRDIASQLYISENTVETHRRNLFTKLHANNMADLMVKAIARGDIDAKACLMGE